MQLSLFQPVPSLVPENSDPVSDAFRKVLTGLLPGPALPGVIRWFSVHEVRLVVTRGRSSKSGDFRPARNGSLPAITVNRTLNPYAFLITLVHEMAHFRCYAKEVGGSLLKRRRRIPPHGERWKEEFRLLLEPFQIPEIFPEPVLTALERHMKNPRAATHTDPILARALLLYDSRAEGILIETLPEGSLFRTSSGMLFRKGEKLRKRYRCLRQPDRRIYLFSPLARVVPADA